MPSFLAVGTPQGSPPISLLDGVSLVAVPAPASIAAIGTGLLALVGTGLARRRRKPA